MALPLPQGRNIQIYRRVVEGGYDMPSMEAAPDHYSLGFVMRGDRRVITPKFSYYLHAGYVHAIPPYAFHRAFSASDEESESILIKFSPKFVEPFVEKMGAFYLEEIFSFPQKVFEDSYRERIFGMAEKMLKVYEEDRELEVTEYKLSCMLFILLMEIHDYSGAKETEDMHNTPLSKAMLDAVFYIEKNYSKPLKIADVALVAGYSVSHFSRMFMKTMNESFSEYLLNVRLKHVQHDLLTTKRSVTEIALENGFLFPGNMSECFKQKFGITPFQYRKSAKRQ